MGNRPLKKVESILDISEIHCLYCGEKNDSDTYYSSDSLQYRAYGKIPYCRDCIDKMYQGYLDEFTRLKYSFPEKRAVQRLCMALDLYYDDKIFENAEKEFKRETEKFQNELTFIYYYIKQVKMYQYRKKSYNSTIENEYKDIKEKVGIMSTFNSDDNEDQEKIAKAVKIFGAGFPDEDYLWLLNEYEDWTSRHECQTKSQEDTFKAICHNRLNAYKANLRGESTKDLDKTFKDLLDTGNLQPKQNKGNVIAEKKGMAELMELWEDVVKKPVPKPKGHLADIDHIGELDGFMRGHTCKMVGVQNFYSEVYSKLMKQFTVNKPEYENDYDSETAFDNLFGDTIDKSTSEE